MGNAVKFTYKGYVKVDVAYDQQSSKLEFKVSDTGMGIKENDHKNLFKLFGKLKTKNGINNNGVGLGLTISKQIIERLGGTITMTSTYNVGTVFAFNIKPE